MHAQKHQKSDTDLTIDTTFDRNRSVKPELAVQGYEWFMARCRDRGFRVEHGEFGAKMEGESLNHGPVTRGWWVLRLRTSRSRR